MQQAQAIGPTSPKDKGQFNEHQRLNITMLSSDSTIQELTSFFNSYIPFSCFIMPPRKQLQIQKYKQCVYFGEMNGGKRNGKGVQIYDNGRAYEGQWSNDLKNGIGYEKFSNGSLYSGKYQAGKPEGHGKLVQTSGEYYEGEWHNGTKHGMGKWEGTKGSSYIGQWRYGRPEGKGMHTWINGDVYKGEFKGSLKEGRGTQKFSNGDTYTGHYSRGKPNGSGQYNWASGSSYKGQFVEGLRQGRGFWKSADGQDSYEGQYFKDEKRGWGTFIWGNGSIYKGKYLHDQRDGYGEMYWKDGSFYKGHWKGGLQHGEGQMYDPAKGYFKGIFANNMLQQLQQQSLIYPVDSKEKKNDQTQSGGKRKTGYSREEMMSRQGLKSIMARSLQSSKSRRLESQSSWQFRQTAKSGIGKFQKSFESCQKGEYKGKQTTNLWFYLHSIHGGAVAQGREKKNKAEKHNKAMSRYGHNTLILQTENITGGLPPYADKQMATIVGSRLNTRKTIAGPLNRTTYEVYNGIRNKYQRKLLHEKC